MIASAQQTFKMSDSRTYNIYEDEAPTLEASVQNWKLSYKYKVQTDENNCTLFLNPPSQWDLRTNQGRANNNNRRLKQLNRLSEKLNQKRKLMLENTQPTKIESKK